MAKRKKTTGRQWTEAEARDALAACESSGLSMRAFAMREGLLPRRLYWWTRRLADSKGDEGAALRFVPAVVKGCVARAEPRMAITIRAGTKSSLEIADPNAVSASWVAEVMTELERLSCS